MARLRRQLVAASATEGQTPSGPGARTGRFALRVGAVTAAGVAIRLWSHPNAGYGIAFWMWACGIVAYALGFQRARQTFTPPSRAVQLGLVGILILAAVLRLVLIKQYPAEIHIDEILPGLEALHIVEGKAPNVFSSIGWFRTPNLAFVFALAGIALGFALECYYPARILLLVCPLFWLPVLRRQPARATVADMAIFGVGALLVLMPLLFSVPWSELVLHPRQVLIVSPWALHEGQRIYHGAGLPAVFRRNLAESTAMFTEWANPCVWHQTPAGLLDVGTLGALIVGLVAAVVKRESDALLLVAWAALTFVLGVAFTDAPRAAYRLAATMPALFILAAYGVEAVLLVTDRAPVSPQRGAGAARRLGAVGVRDEL